MEEALAFAMYLNFIEFYEEEEVEEEVQEEQQDTYETSSFSQPLK